MTKHLHIAQVFVATENHSLSIRFTGVIDLSAPAVLYWKAVCIAKTMPRITVIEDHFAIWTKHKRVDRMIVLWVSGLGENRSLGVGNIVTVLIDEFPNIGSGADDDSIA